MSIVFTNTTKGTWHKKNAQFSVRHGNKFDVQVLDWIVKDEMPELSVLVPPPSWPVDPGARLTLLSECVSVNDPGARLTLLCECVSVNDPPSMRFSPDQLTPEPGSPCCVSVSPSMTPEPGSPCCVSVSPSMTLRRWGSVLTSWPRSPAHPVVWVCLRQWPRSPAHPVVWVCLRQWPSVDEVQSWPADPRARLTLLSECARLASVLTSWPRSPAHPVVWVCLRPDQLTPEPGSPCCVSVSPSMRFSGRSRGWPAPPSRLSPDQLTPEPGSPCWVSVSPSMRFSGRSRGWPGPPPSRGRRAVLLSSTWNTGNWPDSRQRCQSTNLAFNPPARMATSQCGISDPFSLLGVLCS